MRIDRNRHEEFVQRLKQLLRVTSFIMLKGYEALGEEKEAGDCFSVEHVRQLFSGGSCTRRLDRVKVDENIFINTFSIDIH